MPRVRATRIALGGLGVALLVVGAVVLLMDVNPRSYLGLAVWLLGSLIIHDGIVAFAVFGVSVAMRKTGRRIPLAVLAIVQGALVIAAIFTALVVPQILKQGIGSANASILPLNYGLNLVLFYAGLAVATAIAIAAYLRVRKNSR